MERTNPPADKCGRSVLRGQPKWLSCKLSHLSRKLATPRDLVPATQRDFARSNAALHNPPEADQAPRAELAW